MASLHAEAITLPATVTWSTDTVLALFELPFPELLYRATPLHGTARLDPLEFVRTIAVARITMPTSFVRLSAGRAQMSDAEQALCFLAGANSMFSGDKLLTTGNPDVDSDRALLDELGLRALGG
jgi:biotin synthase